MDGKTLLQIALDKMSPNQANQVVERSGLRFQVNGQWASFREGMLRDDNDNPVMTGAGAITGVTMEGQEATAPRTTTPTGTLASGVNAPVFVPPGSTKAAPGAPFQPRGTTPGEGGDVHDPKASTPEVETAGPQLGRPNVNLASEAERKAAEERAKVDAENAKKAEAAQRDQKRVSEAEAKQTAADLKAKQGGK